MKKSSKLSYMPAQAASYPGYYLIPGFSAYAIDKEGSMIRLKKGTRYEVGSSVNWEPRSNRPVVWATPDNGKNQRTHVSYLVCLAFYGPQPANQVVTFRDNNPYNVKSDNLKWGKPGKKSAKVDATLEDKPSLKEPDWYGFNTITYELITAQAIDELSKKTGVASAKIYYSLGMPSFISDTGWVFRNEKIPEWETLYQTATQPEKRIGRTTPKCVYALNTNTGMLLLAPSINQMVTLTKVDKKTIREVFKKPDTFVSGTNGWVFTSSRPSSADPFWVEYDKSYCAFNAVTRQHVEGNSIYELSNLTGCPLEDIVEGLNDPNAPIFLHDWTFSLQPSHPPLESIFPGPKVKIPEPVLGTIEAWLDSSKEEPTQPTPVDPLSFIKEGYRIIPGYCRYAINKKGAVMVLVKLGIHKPGAILPYLYSSSFMVPKVWVLADGSSDEQLVAVNTLADLAFSKDAVTAWTQRPGEPPKVDERYSTPEKESEEIPIVRVVEDTTSPITGLGLGNHFKPTSYALTSEGHLVIYQGSTELTILSDQFETLRRLIQ